MASVICHQFAYHEDNYGYLLHDPATGQTAAIDAGCSDSYLSALDKTGYQLSHILITHHHWDHTDGLAVLKKATGAEVYGPCDTKQPIAALIDKPVSDGDEFSIGSHAIKVITTPGHTLDMTNYYCPDADMLFSGDSLFVLGCGRLFEGDGPMMWNSLSKLSGLPEKTVIYSAHEYGLSNAAFAITIDPDNQALKERIHAIQNARRSDLPTVPSTLADELATNPFLRADDEAIKAHLGLIGASDEEVFSAIRRSKDNF